MGATSEDLLQFLRDAYGEPAAEEAPTAELNPDLVDFLRDFSSTAPRRVVDSMTPTDYQAPRRVLLSEGRGRWRAPAALAAMAAASSLLELHPLEPGRPASAPVRVPPYITELTGRGWIAASRGQRVAAAG